MPREVSENVTTLASYEAAADQYVAHQPPTAPAALLSFLDAIAELLPNGGRVLEIGSATGQDAALLEARGLRVRRTDATGGFVNRLRSQGVEAEILNVLTDELGGPWDGIFANAVFVHLNVYELAGVLAKTARSVTPGGILGFTVKEGDGAGWSTAKLNLSRHFTYWRPASLRAMVDSSPWDLFALDRVASAKDEWLYCLCGMQTALTPAGAENQTAIRGLPARHLDLCDRPSVTGDGPANRYRHEPKLVNLRARAQADCRIRARTVA